MWFSRFMLAVSIRTGRLVYEARARIQCARHAEQLRSRMLHARCFGIRWFNKEQLHARCFGISWINKEQLRARMLHAQHLGFSRITNELQASCPCFGFQSYKKSFGSY